MKLACRRGIRTAKMRGSLPEQNAYKQDDGGASGADHDCLNALDTQDGFLPAFSADSFVRVDLSLYRCCGGLAHGVGVPGALKTSKLIVPLAGTFVFPVTASYPRT